METRPSRNPESDRPHVGAGKAPGMSLLIFLTPVLWGITFPAAKLAIGPLGPLPLLSFMAWSRGLGFLTILVALIVLGRGLPTKASLKPVVRPGLVLGGLLFIAYLLQTWGLENTTATNAGFITGLYVVFTPLLGLLLFRDGVRPILWLAIALSVLGLALLSIRHLGEWRPHAGDILVLGSAVAWAAHVVALGRYAPRLESRALALAQVAVAALLHLIAAAPTGSRVADAASVWHLLLITGVLGTGVAYTLQVIAQREIDPGRAVLILAGESIFSALSAAIWLGERLVWHQWAGAALVLIAMVVSELRARRGPEVILEQI